MNATELLAQLVALQPEFGSFWKAKGNRLIQADGTFSIEAVLTRFADYFRVRHNHMSEDEVKAVATLISWCERDEVLKRAVYSCFLESIADNPPEATISPFLPRESIDFLSYWRTSRRK